MFDPNHFKKQVKCWMRENPDGTIQELVDFCEELIPPAQYTANCWLVDQTVAWYEHIIAHRQVEDQHEDVC